MLARLHCKLYYDEPYLVGQDIICKYILDRWNITVDENYKTEGNTLKWYLGTGQWIWGASATLNTGWAGPEDNGEIVVVLSSDRAKQTISWSEIDKQAAALSGASPAIDHLAEAIPHYHNYLHKVTNPSNKDWLFAGDDPLIKKKD